MTSNPKKAALLSAILVVPPILLAVALIGNPPPAIAPVPAVAAYNEASVDAPQQKPRTLAQVFALRSENAPAH